MESASPPRATLSTQKYTKDLFIHTLVLVRLTRLVHAEHLGSPNMDVAMSLTKIYELRYSCLSTGIGLEGPSRATPTCAYIRYRFGQLQMSNCLMMVEEYLANMTLC